MTLDAMSWALDQVRLEPVDKFVLLCIADMAVHDGRATVTDATIARYTNLPACEVPFVVDRLIRAGLLFRSAPDVFLVLMPMYGAGRSKYRKKVIGAKLRTLVFERDSYSCLRCGQQRDLRADHVIPESLGGEATLENLQTLCASCNSWKGTKIVDFRVQGRVSA
ncbi:HNH endonuclease [Pseudomonas guariconensis]|uniref:HNH endonuclease n=1 Tax=Pseudomonas guariconensis TaxID=1288410 RepID=UPI0039E96EB3